MEQDTPPSSSARYHQLLRAMAPAERLRSASELSMTVRQLALAGLRQRFPEAGASELRVRMAVRLYGREAAQRLGWTVPDDAL